MFAHMPNVFKNAIAATLSVNQKSVRQCEIIVVDNNPASGLTLPVVREFSPVRLISEERRGASYARNAGIAACKGEIIAMIDDDEYASPDWLENLLAPYVRSEVMGVTGNVLPLELETAAQILAFEEYGCGADGRGFVRWDADAQWFKSHQISAVKTWLLGGSGNASFRSSVFRHPEIGLMEETLGAGMPSGGAEDMYFFYRTLKAGCTIVYEPEAFVWHRHRNTMPALFQQLHNCSKGIVAYQLTTLLRDRDWRALPAISLNLALWHMKRIGRRLLGRSNFPISLNLVEIAGYLAGPWALWTSYQRVRRWGRSLPASLSPPASADLGSLERSTI
jgi:cellulose synthase/poly-beta-1,6-N-acetylglucosamine synthase-like glycosyltransferase